MESLHQYRKLQSTFLPRIGVFCALRLSEVIQYTCLSYRVLQLRKTLLFVINLLFVRAFGAFNSFFLITPLCACESQTFERIVQHPRKEVARRMTTIRAILRRKIGSAKSTYGGKLAKCIITNRNV